MTPTTRPVRKKPKREPFPWFPFLVLVATVYLFWFSPPARRPGPVHVTFVASKAR